MAAFSSSSPMRARVTRLPRTRPSGSMRRRCETTSRGASRTLPTAVFALHLKTPEGRHDHGRAAAQYGELARMDTGQSLYYPVELGDRTAFRATIAAFSNRGRRRDPEGSGRRLSGGETPAALPALPADQDLADTEGAQGVGRRDRARDGARVSRAGGWNTGPRHVPGLGFGPGTSTTRR